MKRIVVVIVMTILMMLLYGCGDVGTKYYSDSIYTTKILSNVIDYQLKKNLQEYPLIDII